MKKISQIVIIRLKRLLTAVLGQLPWFIIFAGTVRYGKMQLPAYLKRIFDFGMYEKTAMISEGRLEELQKALSVTNPFGYADYVAAFSVNAFANARLVTLRQTIRILETLLDNCLSFIWFLGCFYLVVRIVRCYHEKTRENEIADAVIEKLKPLLLEINHPNTEKNSEKEGSSQTKTALK